MNQWVRSRGFVLGGIVLVVAVVTALVLQQRSPVLDPPVADSQAQRDPHRATASPANSEPDLPGALERASSPALESNAQPDAATREDATQTAPAKDMLTVRLDQILRLQSAFRASGTNNPLEFQTGYNLLLVSVLARMDIDGRFTAIPPGGQRGGGSGPDAIDAYSGGRHYVIDSKENPTLAQMKSAVDSVDEEGTAESKRGRLYQALALSEDQRTEIVRASNLALEALSRSR